MLGTFYFGFKKEPEFKPDPTINSGAKICSQRNTTTLMQIEDLSLETTAWPAMYASPTVSTCGWASFVLLSRYPFRFFSGSPILIEFSFPNFWWGGKRKRYEATHGTPLLQSPSICQSSHRPMVGILTVTWPTPNIKLSGSVSFESTWTLKPPINMGR